MIIDFVENCQEKIKTDRQAIDLIGDLIPLVREFLAHSNEWLDRTQLIYKEESFTRNVLYADQTLGVFLVTWPIQQVSAIHDHNNTWGIMSVIDGQVLEEEYSVSLQTENQFKVKKRRCAHLLPETIVSFVSEPNLYLHKMGNLSDQPALSLHVYGSALENYYIYDEETGERHLSNSPSNEMNFVQ